MTHSTPWRTWLADIALVAAVAVTMWRGIAGVVATSRFDFGKFGAISDSTGLFVLTLAVIASATHLLLRTLVRRRTLGISVVLVHLVAALVLIGVVIVSDVWIYHLVAVLPDYRGSIDEVNQRIDAHAAAYVGAIKRHFIVSTVAETTQLLFCWCAGWAVLRPVARTAGR